MLDSLGSLSDVLDQLDSVQQKRDLLSATIGGIIVKDSSVEYSVYGLPTERYKKHEALKTTFEVPRYPSRTFPEKLKKRRLELGLKQVELAELLAVNKHTIVKWEKGLYRFLL